MAGRPDAAAVSTGAALREAPAVGVLLRTWRQRRRLSQLDFASDAEISTRHLSFLETGRSRPSREMVLHLAERLEVPLRERNTLLLAAGYAPVFPEKPLDDPALTAAREAIDLVIKGHEPFPAIAIDRHWTLVTANRAVAPFFVGLDASLLQPPINVLRLSLHPKGLAPRIVNLAEWRVHVYARLRRYIDISADPVLVDLLNELRSYEAASGDTSSTAVSATPPYGGVVTLLRIATEAGVLSLFSTVTMFGTPVEVTLSELAIESFFPADAATGEELRRRADQGFAISTT